MLSKIQKMLWGGEQDGAQDGDQGDGDLEHAANSGVAAHTKRVKNVEELPDFPCYLSEVDEMDGEQPALSLIHI